MASKKDRETGSRSAQGTAKLGSSVDELLLAALERGGESLETGRHVVTYRDSGTEEGLKSLKSMGMSVADTRDFKEHAVGVEDAAGADALLFSEIGVAVVSGGVLTIGVVGFFWVRYAGLRMVDRFRDVAPGT